MISDGKIKIPQPDEITQREKDDAMGAYLMMFAAWAVGLPLPTINLIAAFIYHFVNRKKSRFVAFHSLQSILTQVAVTILNISIISWGVRNFINHDDCFSHPFIIYYLYFVVFCNLTYTIFSFIALSYARKGRFFYFWVFGRIAFARYYGEGAIPLEKPIPPNKPPE